MLDDIPEVKKTKTSTPAEIKEAKSFDKQIKLQNIMFFNNRDFVEQKLPKSNWLQLLEVNQQELPGTNTEVNVFTNLNGIILYLKRCCSFLIYRFWTPWRICSRTEPWPSVLHANRDKWSSAKMVSSATATYQNGRNATMSPPHLIVPHALSRLGWDSNLPIGQCKYKTVWSRQRRRNLLSSQPLRLVIFGSK